MSRAGATALFLDTGALFARFVDNAPRHERARAVFDAIQTGELAYRPLYTSTYVLDELTTLIRRKHTHERASATLDRLRQSDSLTLIHPSEADFEAACVQFARYDDHAISFTDHMTGVLAIDRDIEHIFAFDGDFRTLGLTLVPADTGDV
ncbi:type II toxin-antitoxin system VapC family toxin [Halocatena salina]|uniref:PIN domain-containing protein n=1 Tax=Halocatena salina TaxID=2934340 RepID=A0A8U0A834_9EURY|nr:PIN domain-containing protein [Halocatena salina]UPM45272.1 PIN domain-containing protein [Halocatena salina]